jgi:hypothetical protein
MLCRRMRLSFQGRTWSYVSRATLEVLGHGFVLSGLWVIDALDLDERCVGVGVALASLV